MSDSSNQIHHRSCNLCEAICGLIIEHDGSRALHVKGDPDDPLSRGHLCPKATALPDIHQDPDRLVRPQKRTGDKWEEISWEQAFTEIAERLNRIRERHGADSVGVYLGNPTVHNYGALVSLPPFLKLLGTRNIFSATSVDQLPHHFAASFMFGHSLLIPVPDIERTEHMLILGANPSASNGSLMTAPGMRRRLESIRDRGGKVILVDPRKTETASLTDQHHFIRPGTDVWLLGSLLQVIFAEGLDSVYTYDDLTRNLALLKQAVGEVTPERAALITGIAEETIRNLAREFVRADRAVCYGRVGLSTQPHGGLCQWLINALNIVTGNIDRPGGIMFTRPAVDLISRSSTLKHFARWRSRVRQLPELDGHLPVAAMAEEILTAGNGQIHALITNAGNPVLSTPNGRQLDRALESLELMVSVDIYRNETTRHAHYILPPTTGLETDHYDLVFNLITVRNYAKYSPQLFRSGNDRLPDWKILHSLTRGLKATRKHWRWSLIKSLLPFLTPTRLLNIGLLIGPHGLLRSWRGLSLSKLRRHPHGIDLGPLMPRLPKALRTPDRKIDLAPAIILERWNEVMREPPEAEAADSFSLIGRRNLRDNNSWMHNSQRLVKGRNRCTLMMHPSDAERLKLSSETPVQVKSSVGTIELPLEITDAIMPGVVSIPHGYGHDRQGTTQGIANEHPGASINDLTSEQEIDRLTGNAAFSGQRVAISQAQ